MASDGSDRDTPSGELRRFLAPEFPSGFDALELAGDCAGVRRRLAEMERFRSMVDLSSDLLLVIDADSGLVVDANASACRRLGRSRELLLGQSFPDLLEAPVGQRLVALLADCRQSLLDNVILVSSLVGAGGVPFPAEIALACACGAGGSARAAVVAVRDISVRKAAKDQLARLSRAYETLSEINKLVARAGSERELLAGACQVAVEHWGFPLVRVTPLVDDPRVLAAASHYGPAAELLARQASAAIPFGFSERWHLIRLLSFGEYYCSGALERDPMLAPWAAVSREFGVRAIAVFPLHIEGRLTFAMTFHAAAAEDFDPALVRVLTEMAADISFGLDRLAESRRVREAELRYSSIFRFSPSSILILRLADGRVVDANDAFLATFGYSLDETVGRPALEMHLWADIEARAAMFALLAESGRLHEFAARWCRSSGEAIDCLVSGEVIVLGGERHLVCVVSDISRLKESEQRLRDIQGQLRNLGVRREAAREDERKRMAREIHDVLGQLLTALRLDVDMLGMEFGAEAPLLLERTAKTLHLVDSTIAIVRNLATALRPSALDMGIVSALEWQAKEFAGRTGIPCSVMVREGDIDLTEEQAIGVFRLVQESLTNVARHARASAVVVNLVRGDGGYWLSVADDGAGFDPAAVGRTSLGLVGMRERAVALGGELAVHSAPGSGTIIEVNFSAKPAGEAP